MGSLHDVARLAGVSNSTVSRVINDEYGVKESTKIKVLKAVEQCGNMVNQVAKDLKSQNQLNWRDCAARLLSRNSARCGWTYRYFEQEGKHVLLANTHQVHAKEIEYIQIFNQKRVEGIVFYATHLDQPLVHAI